MKWVNLLLRRKCFHHRCSLKLSYSDNPLKKSPPQGPSFIKINICSQLSYSKELHSSCIPRNTSEQSLDHISTTSVAKATHFSHDVIRTVIRSPYYVLQHVIYEGYWPVQLDLVSSGRLIAGASRWSSFQK